MTSMRNAISATALLGLSVFAQAAPLTVVSYDTPNGASGTYHYWDVGYTGSGNTIEDGALLSGGTGDLTDGITSDQNWNNIENSAGTGPYIGWDSAVTPDPIVKFSFGGAVLINSIMIHMDDSDGFGGVATPDAIEVSSNGSDYVGGQITDPTGAAPFVITLPVNLTSSELFVRFSYRNEWIFIDEISFDGTPANVPEPALPALLGLGLAAIGWVRRNSLK